MTNRAIHVFTGSNKDFERFIEEQIGEDEISISYLELIGDYNAKIRATTEYATSNLSHIHDRVDNVVVRSADFGSVVSHVISNFAQIAVMGCDFRTMYIQNPPRQTLKSLEAMFPNTVYYSETRYEKIGKKTVLKAHSKLEDAVLGQEDCKAEIDLSLYKLSVMGGEKPVVLLFYGPSGVGKTETAKQLSEAMGGSLTRIQFSMFQNQEAFDYVFGSEHSKGSFARDLLGRETNVVLLDEFDKVNHGLYNAFYELFDEGVLTDTYYRVEMGGALFVLTTNFGSEKEIKQALGPAMFSRISACIKFNDLSVDEKRTIIDRHFDYVIGFLDENDAKVVNDKDVRGWFLRNAAHYDNMRIMKNKIERAIFGVLTERLLDVSWDDERAVVEIPMND
uniref:AAA family ATPase n=1 Tax=Parolsenella massiliensis TaxID=1871022 RepID=UPI0009323F1A|nr:AAA family ATPase [Parolsenella massiliensis]